MSDRQQREISPEELEIFQEIMNIAFGKAAADLAEVINIFVVLNVPYVRLLSAVEIPGYIRSEITTCEKISIVEQQFFGKFKGNAFLIFPSGAGKELISILGEEINLDQDMGESLDLLEKETLLEVGNILIGACVSKIAELLGDVVGYSPPRVIIEDHATDALPSNLIAPANSAIVLKSNFCFEGREINGYLFLVTSLESINWLKEALGAFLQQYE